MPARKLVAAALLAAGLAGCGATAVEVFNDKEKPLPPGQGAFGEGLTWEWRRKSDVPPAPDPAAAPATPAQASSAEQDEFKKWKESAGRSDRQEFDEWRAWQEWKRNNPK